MQLLAFSVICFVVGHFLQHSLNQQKSNNTSRGIGERMNNN
jgi:hypothetical protein